MICRNCHVSGRVQGVFFRDTVKKQAEALGVTGHAYNMPDGTVEVFMCGTKEQLQVIELWLWEGSSLSEVSEVQCHTINSAIPQRFITG